MGLRPAERAFLGLRPVERFAGLRPVERFVLGYLTVMIVLVVVFRDAVDRWPLLVAGYAALTLPPAVLRPGFLRFAYPVMVLPVAFEAAGQAAFMVHGRPLDDLVTAWERAAFGVHPNVALEWIASPPLTEVLTCFYSSFYAYFVLPLFLYARGRREAAERCAFAMVAAGLVCYLGFVLVPVNGPVWALREEFASSRLAGYVVTPVQDFLMARFDPAGTCVPSSHVAVAWAATLSLRRFLPRPARLIMYVVTAGLTVAVVYTRYHYVSDVVLGLLVAVIAHRATRGRSG
ncbi:MAG TPA: phosphatase PAP2 family protein [Nonomuraea sp.]|nr:phosphatase PAP2 family protein [Nonomuraea sp.]